MRQSKERTVYVVTSCQESHGESVMDGARMSDTIGCK